VTAIFLGHNSMSFGSDIASGSNISFGSNADMATFSGAINAASIRSGAGADTLVFGSNTLAGASIAGGDDADLFRGSITVGSGGVSFWGGVGADAFNFSAISSAGGTAYFWNESGTDSIVFGNAVSYGSGNANVVFGVTEGARTVVSFASSQLMITSGTNSTTNMFGVASDFDARFVSAQVGDDAVTLSFNSTNTGFAGGFGTYVLVGVDVEAITQAIGGYGTGTGTGTWGGSINMPTFS